MAIKLITVFRSPFMAEDKIEVVGEDIEECKIQFFNWWKQYGKSEIEAIATVIYTEVKEID